GFDPRKQLEQRVFGYAPPPRLEHGEAINRIEHRRYLADAFDHREGLQMLGMKQIHFIGIDPCFDTITQSRRIKVGAAQRIRGEKSEQTIRQRSPSRQADYVESMALSLQLRNKMVVRLIARQAHYRHLVHLGEAANEI